MAKKKNKRANYSKFRTAGFADKLYLLWRQGLGPAEIAAALRRAGDKASRGTVSALLKKHLPEFEKRAKSDDAADQAAARAAATGENPALQKAMADLNLAVLKELTERLPDLKHAEVIALANGLVNRSISDLLRSARAALKNQSALKISALVFGNLLHGGNGKSLPAEMSGAEAARLLAGHEGGDLLKNVTGSAGVSPAMGNWSAGVSPASKKKGGRDARPPGE